MEEKKKINPVPCAWGMKDLFWESSETTTELEEGSVWRTDRPE